MIRSGHEAETAGDEGSGSVDLPEGGAVEEHKFRAAQPGDAVFGRRPGGTRGGVRRFADRPRMHQRRSFCLPGVSLPAGRVGGVDDRLVVFGGFDDQRRVGVRFVVGGVREGDGLVVSAGSNDDLGPDVGALVAEGDIDRMLDRNERGVLRAVFVVVGGVGSGGVHVIDFGDLGLVDLCTGGGSGRFGSEGGGDAE